MNERQNPRQNPRFQPKRKKRGAAVAAVLCFVAAIAIVGTYTFKDYRQSQRELQQAKAQAEEMELQNAEMEVIDTEDSKETNTDSIVNSLENSSLKEEAGQTGDITEDEKDETEEDDTEADDGANSAQTAGGAEQVSFSADSKLMWPVEGSLLMNYSMDKTVYFSTLDQFKYNPAIVIEGAKGDQVIASAPGVVKSIDKTAQTGTTVNVDIGGGYELFYGQLADVQVKTGDYVDSKAVIGYVGEPTMYYSVEGTNVYFEMRKDGQPVNPMDYLVE